MRNDTDPGTDHHTENREEWFWMVVSYVKMRMLAVWLLHYPNTSYESFELIWPLLFDQMLAQATTWTANKLHDQVKISDN
jgi:hypothetical protein